MTIPPPDPAILAAALAVSAGQAKPVGALGRLEQLGAWLAACQGNCPPEPLTDVRVVVFAGDHGVAGHGVSAYPSSITPMMVQAIVAGTAGVNVLARACGVSVRVLDLGVDDDLPGVSDDVRAHKVRRSSGAIHLEDALTVAETRAALAAGDAVAADEISRGAQLLIAGDLGIGNTTAAAALIAATCGLPASAVTGRGSGVDDQTFAEKSRLIDRALARCAGRLDDPHRRLACLGSADIAAGVGFMAGAARRGVPVLVDGLIAAAEAVIAEDLCPGAAAWVQAGHRSTEPGQSRALTRLGLTPILDLGMRLGEGSGAVMAVPVLRAAVAVLRELPQLADLLR